MGTIQVKLSLRQPGPDIFRKLPKELLLTIVDHLTVSSIAALLLCSRHAVVTLGTQAWQTLKKPEQRKERIILLSYMEKDDPTLSICVRCLCLYRKDPEDRPLDFRWPNSIYGHTFDCLTKDGLIRLIPGQYTLAHRHARQVMNRHHLGPGHGMPQEFLSGSHASDLLLSHGKVSTQTRVSPHVIDSELLLRIKFTYHILYNETPDHILNEDRHAYLTTLGHHQPDFCPHLKASRRSSPLYQLLECHLLYPKSRFRETYCGVKQCRSCATEYRVSMEEELEKKSLATHITVWKNLGNCGDPMDEKWCTHITSQANNWRVACFRPQPDPGYIQKAFEGEEKLNRIALKT